MGMTIDTAISWLPNIAEHKGEYISICNEDVEAIKIGVETMHKYQKIQEIYQWAKERSYIIEADDIMNKLSEVIDDGNDNN